ncbi:MAG: DEAD/DEAH box helicase [Nitrososphaerales archaeon]
MENFRGFKLAPKIQNGIAAAGYLKPTLVQERTIGRLIDGADVIGQAKTGTGKTAAYGLPLLQSINIENREVQALVLSPTRELAMQITAEIRRLGKYIGARVLTIYGGQSIHTQFAALNRGVHIVVGTPGRVIDHLKRGTLDLGWVKFLIFDEADTMLEMGFIDDVEFIMERTPTKKQLGLFSATMPRRILDLSKKYMKNPEKILVDSDEPSVDTLNQYYTCSEREGKLSLVLELLTKDKPRSSMIFCKTKRETHQLARDLIRRNMNAVALHGDFSQRQRDHSMNLFRSSRVDILVATDVASRGIDVRQVDCVINYQVPHDPLLYFHRVGRTARAGDAGKSYILVSSAEQGDFSRIRNLTKAKIKPLRTDDEQKIQASSYRRQEIRNSPRSRSGSSSRYSRSRGGRRERGGGGGGGGFRRPSR